MKKDTRSEEAKLALKKYRESCDACSTSKVKCSQQHPTCSRCSNLGLPCNYSISQRKGKPRRRTNSNLDELQQQQRRQRSASVQGLGVQVNGDFSPGPPTSTGGDLFNFFAVSPSIFSSPVPNCKPWAEPASYDYQSGVPSSRASSSVSSESVYPSRTNSASDHAGTVNQLIQHAGHFSAVSTAMPTSTSSSPSSMEAFASTQPCYTTAFQSAFAPASSAIMPSTSISTSNAPGATHPQRDQLAFSTLQSLYFPRNISTTSPTQTLDRILTLTDPALSNLSVLLRYPYANDTDFSLFLSQIIFKLLSWYAKISSSPVMQPPRDCAYIPAGPEDSNPMMVQLLIDKLRQVDSVIQEFEGGLKRRADGNTRAMYFAIVASMRERLREMVAGVAGKREL